MTRDAESWLADALPGILRNPVGKASRPLSEVIAALLPIVRELIAEELDAVAAETRLRSNLVGGYPAERAMTRQAARIQARADALRDAR